jgi:hypothetical protein
LKGIQSSKDKKYLQSIDSNLMEEKNDENSKDQSKTKIIGIDQIVVSKEALVNIMSQQVIKKFPNHDYIVS